MAELRPIERLFCADCGREVLLDEAGMTAPPIQPSDKGVRPHVWCKRCVGELQAKEGKEIDHGAPAYQLHTYIWASCDDGRSDSDIYRNFRGSDSGRYVAQLRAAGNIECGEDGRWRATCTPWAGAAKAPPVPDDYASAPAGSVPQPFVPFDSSQTGDPVEKAADDEARAAVHAAAEHPVAVAAKTSLSHRDGRWRGSFRLRFGGAWHEPANPACHGCDRGEYPRLCRLTDGCRGLVHAEAGYKECGECGRSQTGDLPDDPALQDDLPDVDELQAARYGEGIPQVDLQDILDQLKKIVRMLEHLVIMDNERGPAR